MDWYFGNGSDDLVVLRDQKLSDGFPSSPEFWSKWGTCNSENFASPNKCFDMDNMIEEEFEINGLCSEEMETCVEDKDQCSGSVVGGGSSESSLQRTAISCDHQDYQLDNFAGIEQLDDIFLDSLLEDLPRKEDVHNSYCFTPESQCFMLPVNSLSMDMTFDLQSNSSDKHSKGSSKYLKTRAFSPSVGWEKGEVAADSSSIPCNSEQRDFLTLKATLVKVRVPSEQNAANGPVGEKPSVEESVMQDLKMVMTQLTDETRLFFRDAFYRLAKNSKQNEKPCQNGDYSSDASPGTDHDISKRSGKRKQMESETNVFDRAIANLVFHKMDSNVPEFPSTADMYPRQEVIRTLGSPMKQSSKHREVDSLCCSTLTGDAEVPRLGQKYPNKDFSEVLSGPK